MFGDNGLALVSNHLTPQSVQLMSRPMQRQVARQVEQVVAQGLTVKAREDVRALMAHAALQNAAALTALTAHLVKVAPLGAPVYEAILEAYGISTAQAIARW